MNFENVIEISKLFINNNPDYAICPSSSEIFIIDLTIISLKLSPLDL